ncbi:hypothetical protein ACFFKE_15635 [Streptomyces mutabilis]|uniref:hypothetical protein n=1 Tax=Streptomyces mutabilis TaxID=67332 RepID=UPI00177AE542|nr:hypothetical protein [Streptomyces mutabilis]
MAAPRAPPLPRRQPKESPMEAHGKAVDSIASPEVLLHDGTRLGCGETSDEEYARMERQGDKPG